MDEQSRALAQQAELYGAPLGVTVRDVAGGLGLTQAAVARVLGVSAPMLSQLISGHRIKLGNPQAVQRLQALVELLGDVRSGLPHEQVAPRLEEISTTAPTTLTRAREPSTDVPAAFSRLLRAVASGRDLTAAAAALDEEHPALAEVLRVYGTSGPEQAAAHFDGVRHLL